MREIYIAGPYTAPTEEQKHAQVDRANRAAQLFATRGYAVFCPHRQSADWEHDTPMSYLEFLAVDFQEILRRREIAILQGWSTSTGTCAELALALARCRRVHLQSEKQEDIFYEYNVLDPNDNARLREFIRARVGGSHQPKGESASG